jgi:glycosyltransferase involved in cell wall biosynthesis
LGKIGQLAAHLARRVRRSRAEATIPYPVVLKPAPVTHRGRALISYLAQPCWEGLGGITSAFRGHSNKWESFAIARAFAGMGYDVDVINWDDQKFTPHDGYDVVFDIYVNHQYYWWRVEKSTPLILHLTGSYARYHNAAELRRLTELEQRRQVRCAPRRLVKDEALMDRALEQASACTLIGNAHTLSTFPKRLHHKIHLVTVSASANLHIKNPQAFVPIEREFLWFFGSGAVHKGLDLVLEVFAKKPDLRLNIIGDLTHEGDFVRTYERELTRMSNIVCHGYITPDEPRFEAITQKCFAFLAPSCSESISTAVATCMQIGLFPILSRDTGVDLPADCGISLGDCTVEEIEGAVTRAHTSNADLLIDQIKKCQELALRRYSQDAFRHRMDAALTRILG